MFCDLSYTIGIEMVCDRCGSELPAYIFLKGLKEMSMSSITHFFKKKTSPGIPFFGSGIPT